ncbi:delta6 fatty acid desaturase [Auriscalpium vulgare]|uniref:Delta6 fatty acid desaturase n=1 Tax=Auriscalpium vulgare TaxID=40419 RepID=A0ACB8RWF1_9AGAM|nr:delta6 fatty acid desaturase [Auriscalpium vulgare]
MESFTRERVRELGYIIVEGKVYDAREFGRTDHPGGEVLLTQLGRDTTDAFRAFHPDSAYEGLASFYVGDLACSEEPEVDAFTLDMRALEDTLRKHGYYEASLGYFAFLHLIGFSLLGTSVLTLYRYGHTVGGVMFSAIMLALFFQQAGWLGHDFCHKQVSANPAVSYVGSLAWGALAEGFSMRWWNDKHSRHHSTPNIHGCDPDIDTHPYLSWSDDALELFTDVSQDELTHTLGKLLVTHQVLCYFPLLTFARVMWNVRSLLYDFRSSTRASYIERACLVLHWVWVIALMRLAATPALRALFLVSTLALSGQFIAMVFSLNHNGTVVISKVDWDASLLGFAELQVRTSRDIACGALGAWFCGGLHEQVTHHLFPRMPRHRYADVQPAVRALCEKHGVPYRRTGFVQGTKEVLARLNEVADKARRMAVKIGQ